jgi:Domain of unknown function (DUF222)/HNH endonuclease
MSGAHSTTLESLGADLISAVGGESDEELRAGLDDDFEVMKAAQGRVLLRLGECGRRQTYRDDGATSVEAWVVQRYGVSATTARGLTQPGKVASDLPHLVGSLCAGDADISLDKVRALADVATPETDAAWRDQARECSVRDLVEVARTRAAAAADRLADKGVAADTEHDRRYLRFNDEHRTLSAQLPPDSYAEVKAKLEARAKDIDSDGETPWDQRLCDGFLDVIGSQAGGAKGAGGAGGAGGSTVSIDSPRPFFVVAHVPLASLVEDTGQASPLAGELEHVGLIDIETVKRIACDATVAVAVDDDVGHTMYEGRARRFPTGAQRREVRRRDRHCRFPGCRNLTFAHVHHVVPWDPVGPTDLGNLVLLCKHHHGVVHRNGWTMKGNANEELIITAPKGRIMTSRPSPLWTRVSTVAGPH